MVRTDAGGQPSAVLSDEVAAAIPAQDPNRCRPKNNRWWTWMLSASGLFCFLGIALLDLNPAWAAPLGCFLLLLGCWMLTAKKQDGSPLFEPLARGGHENTIDEATGDLQHRTLFHGTSLQIAQKIQQQGFVASTAGCLGPGIYLAGDRSKAENFARATGRHHGTPALLTCNVWFTKLKIVASDDQEGKWRRQGYDGCLADHTTRSERSEYCIKAPEQIRVVSVERIGGLVAAPPAPQATRTESALPAGWQEVKDPQSGVLYYWNAQTSESTWERPVA